MTESLQPGFLVLHSHRLENLRDVLVHWLRAHPLAPLERETVLVQSNGMAQWLKAALAADVAPADPHAPVGLGICAGLEVVFPARFLWQAMRAVLGRDAVPESSPFDKPLLRWRILRLLPVWVGQDAFAVLRDFLADDHDGRRADQLAERLADLFDQYQVYRADWLNDWSAGRDQLRDRQGGIVPLPERERWQAAAWRALEADVATQGGVAAEAIADWHRAGLQQRFVARLRALQAPPPGLPRRVIVWGLSTLPQPVLEGLAALSRHVQVVLAVVNPCQHYWTDLVQPPRHARHGVRPGLSLPLQETELDQAANPLLLAWGQQGRDYLALLAEHDDSEACLARFRAIGQRIDLFDEPRPPRTLLTQLQAGIRELTPLTGLPEHKLPVDADDASLVFQVTHSRLREVEALHDHLLALFAGEGLDGPPLRPQDVVIMVPDIRDYAPLIRAVFRQQPDTQLPFDILDRPRRGDLPLLAAVEWLLRLPEARCTLAELWDLLDVPAVCRAVGLAPDRLPLLRRWFEAAGARWGLDARHREQWQLPPGLAQNTWRFALDRLLLGYASGPGEPFAGLWPHAELSALEAEALGPVERLLSALADWAARLDAEQDVRGWRETLQTLLATFIAAETPEERWLLEQLARTLADWSAEVEAAAPQQPLSLPVVREAWLSRLDEASMSQRFLSGAIPVATLMPMRAIPFRVVCILGLNDGEFPRQRAALDFDLMAMPGQRRAGDRSRRDDDRYLFLEALLSARDHLLLSRVGRSARQDTPLPPSLLIAQLQDALVRGWHVAGHDPAAEDAGEALLARLTRQHALQPFSPRYFTPGSGLVTHAQQWRAALDTQPPAVAGDLPRVLPDGPLELATLVRWLRNPVAAFYHTRLGVTAREEVEALPDHEPFTVDGLVAHGIREALLESLLATGDREALDHALARQRGRGLWPVAAFADLEQARLAETVESLWQHAAAWRAATSVETPWLDWSGTVDGHLLRVSDQVPGLRAGTDGLALWHVTASRVLGKSLRLSSLLPAWVAQLFLAVCGRPMPCHVLTPDGQLTLPPLADAAAHWQALLTAWLAGQQHPAPFAAKTALAWVAVRAAADRQGLPVDADKQRVAASAAYDGGHQHAGERERGLLGWAYPDFDQLTADGRFATLAETLFLPWVAALEAAQAEGGAHEPA